MTDPAEKSGDPWLWPDSLDALIAAPDNHIIVMENDRVRVVRTRILPGQTVPIHTHRWPCVLTIHTWSHMIRRDHLGRITLDTRQAPEVPLLNTPMWHAPIPPHSVENVGGGEINTVQVEIKNGW